MFGTLVYDTERKEPTFVENPDPAAALSRNRHEKRHVSCEYCRARKVRERVPIVFHSWRDLLVASKATKIKTKQKKKKGQNRSFSLDTFPPPPPPPGAPSSLPATSYTSLSPTLSVIMINISTLRTFPPKLLHTHYVFSIGPMQRATHRLRPVSVCISQVSLSPERRKAEEACSEQESSWE